MTGLVRKATLLSACGLFVAAAAMAGVPSPGNSTVPGCLTIVASTAGVPDPLGTFTLVVRDLANNPINNSSVVVDLGNCSDAKLAANQLDLAAVVDCATKTVRKNTDATGTVSFRVMGGSANTGNSPGAIAPCCRIFADGVQLATPRSPILDQDGVNGVGANDLSAWISDFGSGIYKVRSDYDCLGTLGANDLSLWITAFGLGGSASSSIYCP